MVFVMMAPTVQGTFGGQEVTVSRLVVKTVEVVRGGTGVWIAIEEIVVFPNGAVGLTTGGEIGPPVPVTIGPPVPVKAFAEAMMLARANAPDLNNEGMIMILDD